MLHLFPLQPLLENLSKVNIFPLVNITLEDAGEYVCKAENSAGQATRSAWVEVLSGKSYHLIPSNLLIFRTDLPSFSDRSARLAIGVILL